MVLGYSIATGTTKNLTNLLTYRGLQFVQYYPNVADQLAATENELQPPEPLFAWYGGEPLTEVQVMDRVDLMVTQRLFRPPESPMRPLL